MTAEGGPARTARNLAPFAVASVLAWGAVLISASIDWEQYALGAGLALVAGALRVAPLRGALATAREVFPSLIFLAGVALLRSSAGGANSGVAVVALLPVFQTALRTSDRRQLGAVTLGLAVFFLMPVLVIGPPTYPSSQYRAGLLFVAVSSIIGLATQRLLGRVRSQAAEAELREQMLKEVTLTIKDLYDSTPLQARTELCKAAKRISDASFAVLYEPSSTPGGLCTTAMAGLDVETIEIGPDEKAGALEVFVSGRTLFYANGHATQAISHEIWELTGRPESVLFEPLLRGSEPVGVLVVGWAGVIAMHGVHTSVISLLAHEVTAVIERADLLTKVTDMASTDPLTGLPNRRAWDASLTEALAEDQELMVVMLDFDRFKEFNDTQGHPSGDRLLKEAAAVWREELRGGDVLARLGGDEFALLLPGSSSARALAVIERLRQRVPGEQTCSAGLASRGPGDSAETLMAAADGALYEAKSAGRDRAHVHH